MSRFTLSASGSFPSHSVSKMCIRDRVEIVEPEVIKDWDSATTGDVIAIFANLNDYAINSNLEIKRCV